MVSDRTNQVFISYNWQDRLIAERVRSSLPPSYRVWIDNEQIRTGDQISARIVEGLKETDYYIILISENSKKSAWVQRELAIAFGLASAKKLSIVPILLDNTEVPFELAGLLYLDFSKSLSMGLKALRDFFVSQQTDVGLLEERQIMLKSDSDATHRRRACNESLRGITLGELRHRVTDRISLEEVGVIWFDLFERRMNDEVHVSNLAASTVELIDRCRRMEKLVDLLDTLCRNHPHISAGL
ncbi:MAG: toll/interleukin-1 receptor domain-containing protein [Cypionkella sp.]